MLWEAYAVLPGANILFFQSLSHPVSTFYSIICHNFSDVPLSVIPHPTMDNDDAPAELAAYHLLWFNLVRVEIRELRPKVIAENDEILVHYRSRTKV